MSIYTIKDIDRGVRAVSEKIVSEFLFEGKDKVLLVDTGMDIFNLKKYLGKTLGKKKEIMVLNTHYHPDHSNGNHRFDKVYIGAKDVPFSDAELAYDRLVKNISGAVYSKIPILSFPFRPLVNKLAGTKPGKTEYISLYDGDEIDLGGKKLIVRELPGHTAGSIVLLDKERKTIYTGDAVNTATWMWTNPDMKLSEYAENLKAFYAEMKKEGYKTLRCSHVDAPNKLSFIKDYAKFIENIKPGSHTIRIKLPGMNSALCIKMRPSLKHKQMCCFYLEEQLADWN